ncbi:(2Fe-2S)-binding protein [Streptomyces aidingensis]|uniref:Carbon-monoxide dehydrogenase small subunit n=1 Tax=Streptomyces aidingensis TaxID=910347 RepID=A0A1I1IXE7_9ACTN|nr:(2Fe-2S)-binding protein [Streptomyces aidingensis]SFC39008.1 carbon-monoxide dehydrogenase small subunit [Streptomyces aidingensis]
MRVSFTVNGRPQRADNVWEGESLLHVLRERLGLPGSKNACEQGECGSCTVRLDGVPVCACLVAAGQAEGREVLTVEGLAEYARQRDRARPGPGGQPPGTAPGQAPEEAPAGEAGEASGEASALAPVQQAFLDAGAVQCGFCTPGLLVAADELLERNPQPADADIREALAGNLCRCTGYETILDAVRLAAARTTPAAAPAAAGDGTGERPC